MSPTLLCPPWPQTADDPLSFLGEIPPERIRLSPVPGTATEDDLIANNDCGDHALCELVNGVLVEKPMGYFEARLAHLLGFFMETYLSQNDIGMAIGADGMVEVAPRKVRLPDLSFYLWSRFPNRLLPLGAILRMTPDLAVEVLSPSNTVKEMARKLREYFAGGAQQVWYVDPEVPTVQIFTAVDKWILLAHV